MYFSWNRIPHSIQIPKVKEFLKSDCFWLRYRCFNISNAAISNVNKQSANIARQVAGNIVLYCMSCDHVSTNEIARIVTEV